MDFTPKEIFIAVVGSGGIISGLFVGLKWLYERLDLKDAKKQTAQEKAYEAVWKLYDATKKEKEDLEAEIAELKKGDSLARPTVSRIYQAVRKLAKQIEIIDALLVKELPENCDYQLKLMIEAVKKEIELLWQKFDDLEKTLP